MSHGLKEILLKSGSKVTLILMADFWNFEGGERIWLCKLIDTINQIWKEAPSSIAEIKQDEVNK